MDKEKKPKVFQIILVSACAIFSTFAYIPKGTSTAEIILAVVIFFLILYVIFRVFRRLNIN